MHLEAEDADEPLVVVGRRRHHQPPGVHRALQDVPEDPGVRHRVGRVRRPEEQAARAPAGDELLGVLLEQLVDAAGRAVADGQQGGEADRPAVAVARQPERRGAVGQPAFGDPVGPRAVESAALGPPPHEDADGVGVVRCRRADGHGRLRGREERRAQCRVARQEQPLPHQFGAPGGLLRPLEQGVPVGGRA
ncbi:hypothetical protein ACFQ60_38730 [Streptomyces zhihengii]